MSTSSIVLMLVLGAGIANHVGRGPGWALQPATAKLDSGRVRRHRAGTALFGSMASRIDDDSNIIMDTLRVLGIVRRRVDRPVVGRKAYTRWWERIRAILGLAIIVIALGLALAAVVGITVLGLGFLLEQAIS